MNLKKGLLIYSAKDFLAEQVIKEQSKRDDIFLARSPQVFKQMFVEKRDCFHVVGIECEHDYDPKELLNHVVNEGFDGKVYGIYHTVYKSHIRYLSDWPTDKWFSEMFAKLVMVSLD